MRASEKDWPTRRASPPVADLHKYRRPGIPYLRGLWVPGGDGLLIGSWLADLLLDAVIVSSLFGPCTGISDANHGSRNGSVDREGETNKKAKKKGGKEKKKEKGQRVVSLPDNG